ncbi:gliding motility protein RemB [Mucilaginibacter frigoritolerans]|nr:gliding motility protein RemB [Mucilaginibacter frigoritolerans]
MHLLHKYKTGLIALIITISAMQMAVAQSEYQPYSFQFYQKFSDDLYSRDTRIHTSIAPYFVDDSLLKKKYDSLMNVGVKTRTTWLGRKLFNEHQIDVKGNNYTLYGDFLPDVSVGRDFSNHANVWNTTIGYQMGGNVGKQFSFYGSIYENKAQFPAYITNEINSTYYIPGEGKDNNPGQNVKNWLYTSFLLSYTPVKYVNFSLGKDKTFIGDGYRSMLLSDFASNYPFFKITATLGNVRYMTMYAFMDDPNAPQVPNSNSTRKKWAYFQYVDWNVSKRFSVGLFQNVMAVTRDSTGQRRGFDPSLASPFILLSVMNNSENDPDKNLLGLTSKFKLFNKTIIYGQFALNEFRAQDFFSSDGSYTNKFGFQLGVRGADLFNVKGLNYLGEYNSARPYTYSSFDQTSNYSQDDQPLADPFGANFREWVGILNYSAGRFDFQGQFDYAYFGLDLNGADYGQNIFISYNKAVHIYGNYIGQGLSTNYYYGQGKVSYLLNPKYNLRLEFSALFRDEKNSVFNAKTSMITIGLRSSFRNIYTDF